MPSYLLPVSAKLKPLTLKNWHQFKLCVTDPQGDRYRHCKCLELVQQSGIAVIGGLSSH